MQENKDCPICGQKGVLIFVPSKPYTNVRGPGTDSGGQRIYGNASYEMTNTYWDVTKHAKVCPNLFYVKEGGDREYIINYHLGRVPYIHGDHFSLDQYEQALSESNFCFWSEASVGKVTLSIVHKHNKLKKYMETEASTLDIARKSLRQKLLSGEGVILENGDAYQMMQIYTPEDVTEEKKSSSSKVVDTLLRLAKQTKLTFTKVATRSPS